MNEYSSHPLLLVIFGISGDLAHRKLMPALASLFANGHLPDSFSIVGVSRRKDYTVDTLFDDFRRFLPEPSGEGVDLEALKSHCSIITNDQETPDDFIAMRTELEAESRELGQNTLRIYYLSVPAQAFISTVTMLGKTGHQKPFAYESVNPRILVEKPFGYDSASAKELIAATEQAFNTPEIYRIDHYLAKETAQNLLAFRAHNPMFEPIWNASHIDRITVGAYEQIGVEGRAVFYEKTGALRDLIQSHLLQLLALVTMEQPRTLTSDEIHSLKLELMKSIVAVRPQDAIRGQYEGYREEIHNLDSHVETFARLTLSIDNERWQGTPIVVETGKGLDEKTTFVCLHFRETHTKGDNTLRFSIQPREGITVTLQAKKPGLSNETETVNMTFGYEDSFKAYVSEAYERVIMDAIKGDQSLFASSAEVMESWRIIEPAIESWRKNGDDLKLYPFGASANSI
jgi:glucose-6-phosphate 1-dehydrogenase